MPASCASSRNMVPVNMEKKRRGQFAALLDTDCGSDVCLVPLRPDAISAAGQQRGNEIDDLCISVRLFQRGYQVRSIHHVECL